MNPAAVLLWSAYIITGGGITPNEKVIYVQLGGDAIVQQEKDLIHVQRHRTSNGVPEKIEDYKNLPFEGIGLMRTEFILASYSGTHPVEYVETGKSQEFVDKLADGYRQSQELSSHAQL